MLFAGVQLWNKLDENMTNQANLQSFKNKLKLYIIQKEYFTILATSSLYSGAYVV